jgi:trehalose-6-phosphate synthase
VTPIDAGEYSYKMSSGGLVTALSGLFKEMKFKWIGWPGFSVESKEEQEIVRASNTGTATLTIGILD